MNTVTNSVQPLAAIRIKYLGQCGFLFSTAAETVVVDPYLSDSVDRLPGFSHDFWKRTYPPPAHPSQLNSVDLVLCTHAHLDHADPETLAAIAEASPQCLFGGPASAVDVFLQSGIAQARTVPLDDGVTHCFRDIEICPIAVPHETYESDENGHQLYLSYLIKWSGRIIFHGGDMLATQDIERRVAAAHVDVAFLPINGRNDLRRSMGIAGNMTVPEAIQFAADCHFPLVVPTHYDLYPNNGESLELFSSTWTGHPISRLSQWKGLSPGEEFYLATPSLQEKALNASAELSR